MPQNEKRRMPDRFRFRSTSPTQFLPPMEKRVNRQKEQRPQRDTQSRERPGKTMSPHDSKPGAGPHSVPEFRRIPVVFVKGLVIALAGRIGHQPSLVIGPVTSVERAVTCAPRS